MFQDALLESAPRKRKRNHWAMATAFAVELAVAAVLILLPLVSTGIIPLKATVIVPTPQYTPVTRPQPTPPSGHSGGVTVPAARVIPVSTSDRIPNPFGKKPLDDPTEGPPPLNPCIGNCENRGPIGMDLVSRATPLPPPPPPKPVVISHTTEAMLLNKVVPEYPLIAKLSGLQGDVKLHAFVDKNGNIRSLTVMGNPPPVLLQAAMNAVQQWKYRPYYLNGEAVEIETFITVTFKKSN